MKRLTIIFFLMALGLATGVQDVRAQNTQNADLHPPYLAEEERAAPEGKEFPALEESEEGEITERGVRRFRLKPGKRIVIPKKPNGGTKKFRLKRHPLVPPNGSSTTPPGGGGVPPVEPSDSITPPGPIEPPDFDNSPTQCVWHTSDILDQRIDISAQKRLMAMMSRGGEERQDASAMIGAVKQGALAGILLAPRKAVSDRGQRMAPAKGWWELIPQGQLGTCLQEPLGESPMILYRDKNGETNLDPSVIDHTLRTMWGQCGLPTPVPACSYLVDLHKPPPQPGTPEEKEKGEGFSILTVHVTGAGYPLRMAMVSVSGTYEHEEGSEKRQRIWGTTAPTATGKAKLVVPDSLQMVTVIVQGRDAVATSGVVGFSDATYVIGGSILDQMLSVDLEPLGELRP